MHALVSANADEHGIVIGGQLFQGHVHTDIDAELEFYAHFSEHFAAADEHFFFQFESRDAEGEQTTDFGRAFIHSDRHAIAYEHIGATQACWACTNHGHAFGIGF